MDASLASAGFGAVSSYITASANASVQRTQANSANFIRQVNNITAGVASRRNASITALQRWAQDVRNDRVYEQVGKAQEALAVNFNRSRDARARANFADNVRDAEENGRLAASAAASGVTGSIVDVIDQTVQLKQALKDSARVDAERQVSYDFKVKEFDQRWAILDQLDHSLIFDNPELLDFGRTTPNSVNPLSAAVGSLGVKGLQAIGTGIADAFSSPSGSIVQTVGQQNGGITGAVPFSFSFGSTGAGGSDYFRI